MLCRPYNDTAAAGTAAVAAPGGGASCISSRLALANVTLLFTSLLPNTQCTCSSNTQDCVVHGEHQQSFVNFGTRRQVCWQQVYTSCCEEFKPHSLPDLLFLICVRPTPCRLAIAAALTCSTSTLLCLRISAARA
jgi:hypothetical protein